ncbi:MAG TPA: prepilin-type N-terminal cleavage/methylation domain-containing protein [Vicinamibacteria bacterium]|nr:prepilin-type N-terminal cleavage/methylation domain-containing protein [Vicinamibacteria bacterium]
MKRTGGFTYIELIIATFILAILAAAVVPVAEVTAKRAKEVELRRDLRIIRDAIDNFKQSVDLGLIGGSDVELGSEGYPKDLEMLVEGVSQVGAVDKKLKFLRRIPMDPMTHSVEWGLRSYQDEPDSMSWGGQNVYDVYTTSRETALDGTNYRDW